ncbi:MAG: DUF4242 domain-containing protein [Deferribacterales bacterium]
MDKDRRKFLIGTAAVGAAAAFRPDFLVSQAYAKTKEDDMKPLKFFIDTHDKENQTFPAKISPAEFEQFYAKYKEACYEEGVIPVRLHVGYDDGRAFCLTMAPSEEAVKNAHKRVGLPYDTISEVVMATPGDAFFMLK